MYRAETEHEPAPSMMHADDKDAVDLFDRNAKWWHDVYAEDSLDGAIYRRRELLALQWLEGVLGNAAALDAGCGAARVAWQLAHAAWPVIAFDPSENMLAMAKAASPLHASAPRFVRANADAIPLASSSCSPVVALGLLPWLSAPEHVLRELRRVTREGGYVLLTSDNRWRLAELVSMDSLLPSGLRHRVRALAQRFGWRVTGVYGRRYSQKQVRTMLLRVGLVPVRETTLGFGPVKVLGFRVLPDAVGRRLDSLFQRLADQQRFGLHRLGNHHVVLAEVVA